MKAFPNHPDAAQPKHLGMDLRDWFAGLAMQGELASQDPDKDWDDCDRLAQYAYCLANAMMKARDDNNE